MNISEFRRSVILFLAVTVPIAVVMVIIAVINWGARPDLAIPSLGGAVAITLGTSLWIALAARKATRRSKLE